MKITICSSLDFSQAVGEVAKELNLLGHQIFLPATAEKILQGQVKLEDIKKAKADGSIAKQAIENNVIMTHYKKILASEAILVLNYSKNNIANYIGGSVFLEMGLAYVNNKKIFLLNNMPDMPYSDELLAMEPIILSGDLKRIK
ncbi:MAG: hypothetical protein PHO91_01720 [Patescibacteria group bacterium]|nr:hypothetical protein [Patescibacteria group bacterium]